jgi:NAD-dependent deacetylase
MINLVVLTGAGMSAESGLQTFRDSGGLWEGHNVTEVASIDVWHLNPAKVLQFYNARRKAVKKALPNLGHYILADLEKELNVTIITQNIDDLHERAGSTKVIRLHAEINKCWRFNDENQIYNLELDEINIGNVCPKGAQLRPHIVWFGQAVPMMDCAVEQIRKAELVLIVSTSFQVYPAAGLIRFAGNAVPIVVIDPNPNIEMHFSAHHICKKAAEGLGSFKAWAKKKGWLP